MRIMKSCFIDLKYSCTRWDRMNLGAKKKKDLGLAATHLASLSLVEESFFLYLYPVSVE